MNDLKGLMNLWQKVETAVEKEVWNSVEWKPWDHVYKYVREAITITVRDCFFQIHDTVWETLNNE